MGDLDGGGRVALGFHPPEQCLGHGVSLSFLVCGLARLIRVTRLYVPDRPRHAVRVASLALGCVPLFLTADPDHVEVASLDYAADGAARQSLALGIYGGYEVAAPDLGHVVSSPFAVVTDLGSGKGQAASGFGAFIRAL
jgi:hypothetical protein